MNILVKFAGLFLLLQYSTLNYASAGEGEPTSDLSESKADDGVVILGTFAGRGVECPLFRLNEGEIITLSGQIPELQIGEEIGLIGRWSRLSTCMQGKTFRVLGLTEAK